MLNEDSVDIL